MVSLEILTSPFLDIREKIFYSFFFSFKNKACVSKYNTAAALQTKLLSFKCRAIQGTLHLLIYYNMKLFTPDSVHTFSFAANY